MAIAGAPGSYSRQGGGLSSLRGATGTTGAGRLGDTEDVGLNPTPSLLLLPTLALWSKRC